MTDAQQGMPLTLNILSWNVGGLNGSTRKYKVKDFVGKARDKPDVIAIQEHKLDVFSMTAIGHLLSRELHTICSPGQKGVRGEGTGGTALLIHRSFRVLQQGTSEDGYVTWAQIEKGGHEIYIASIYGPHTPGARAAHWAHLRNMFPHTNIILCGDWNMVERSTDASGERQVLGGAEGLTFTEFRAKHNLIDLREIVAETRGPLHTRWSAYGGDPRWARLDRVYFSHGGRWLAAARYLHHNAENTLSDHLPVSASIEVGTVVCEDGRLSLTGPTTFKWSPSLLAKPQIQEEIKKIWGKLAHRKDDPRKLYYKGTTQVRNFLRAKQKEQRARLSRIHELQREIEDLHTNRPGDLTCSQLERLDWLETEKRIREHERDVEIRLWSRVKHLGLGDAPTKILAGRLQLLLQKIVFPQQTGFIKGRQMLDNVLALWMAQDAAKTIKRKGMFVKLDFEKAYDRVEHNYLWDTMNKCGLGQQFTALVKGLTLGASTAVHINGAKTYRFPVGRGVRQGCPLAPLLFVLATQPLMAEMKLSFQAGRLRGYQVGETVILDYSLFADDMGVFIDDSFESFQELRVVLAKYEGSSGARLNLSKSSILLLGMDRPPDWLPLTGCALMQRGEINKYLGAPTGLEVSKHQQDDFCTQKISKTLGGWELRLLSFEARVVLLQVVLQAQPTFYTSIIRLSATTCRKVEQLYRHFLWGYNKEGTAKRSLVRWDLVCRPKAQGGLGIRSLPDTNSSLMGKWVGSVIDEETGTWGGALSDLVRQGRAKYHRDVVRKHYSLPDLILTRQPLHLAGTDVAKALLTSWKAIQGDITWDPEGVAIPRYITLRDIVSLVANNRQEGEAATKQIMAGLRELKVTQIEHCWRRKETLKRLESNCQPQMGTQHEGTADLWTRNSIDKAISQWRESSADPPQRQWLEIARILQKAIAMSIVTRIERWLENMLATVDRVEGRSEAPCTEGAAIGLEVTALPVGRA
ncbi:hypothetical protein AXG93_815s1430 [Marchantia polymorpha subsp. ruderalis]|uniref:Reverse transcriptase domain-containing protein n=1 Tax=Marchantia polymorpha subsp. ruderalis TaxID=1480154 RepID=A0A176W082_MARPO|nr:hypothetical protein AXG93_815s1430 [Marchantia polymorpha subsp. ruderalis]